MKLIGAAAVIYLYWCIVNLSVTGRWAYLALMMWSVPCIGAAYFAPADTAVNGLVMLICLVAMLSCGLAVNGVKMWNKYPRKKHRYICIVFYIISLVFFYYCAYESQRLGYIPNIQGIGTGGGLRKTLGVVLFMALNIPATSLLMEVIDRFFSNKSDFVIIKCATFIDGTLGKFDEKLLKNRYLCGINNGKEYYFGITNKAYVVLKNVHICRLKLKKGVLGGIYVTEYPPGVDEKLSKSADKWLKKKAVSATIIFVIVVLILKLD